eukprot:Skav219590  [mRNA]  locus=scaffold1719:690:977:+ [translate_table: standard]
MASYTTGVSSTRLLVVPDVVIACRLSASQPRRSLEELQDKGYKVPNFPADPQTEQATGVHRGDRVRVKDFVALVNDRGRSMDGQEQAVGCAWVCS